MRGSSRRLTVAWALAVALIGCADEARLYTSLGPRYEARAWLATNRNPHPLASNRFESPTAARAFIDSLYTSGADTVYVVNVQQDSAWIAGEGGPYADALLVRLPADPVRRASVFAISAREARREGFGPERDRGRRYLFFWWD